jgi:hypothetical protein
MFCPAITASRHPGLDPGSMNTALYGREEAEFMDSGLRRNDGEGESE